MAKGDSTSRRREQVSHGQETHTHTVQADGCRDVVPCGLLTGASGSGLQVGGVRLLEGGKQSKPSSWWTWPAQK